MARTQSIRRLPASPHEPWTPETRFDTLRLEMRPDRPGQRWAGAREALPAPSSGLIHGRTAP
jgi:hypothetical protein